MRKRPQKPAEAGAPYEPTKQEREVVLKWGKSRESEPPSPKVKVRKEKDGGNIISNDHPDKGIAFALLAQALGTTNADFVNGILRQLVGVISSEEVHFEDHLNFLLSAINGVKANDQLEAMLAAQMAVVHLMTMKLAQRLRHAEILPQQDSAERALNKLARTFTTQLEALKRYRSGGEQKVTVQHVSVSEGGQAIVGNVTQANPETKSERPKNRPLALTERRQVPMPLVEERATERSSVRPIVKNAKQP
jgi:RecC C-terminal domain